MKNRKVIAFYLILAIFLFHTIGFTEDDPKPERTVPELRASRVNSDSPVIDGNLNDAIWSMDNLEFARDFTQKSPDEGKAATESTLVATVYDDDAIYFAFWCYDSHPEKINPRLVRRDRYAETDNVVVRLDPYHDHQTGFRFELSVAGVQRDHKYFDDDNMDESWNAVWDGATKIQPWGWSAEFCIPYHCLRFTEKDEHTWGANFARSINSNDEDVDWAFSPSEEGGFVSRFGHLTGLSGIEPARHLAIMPYSVGKMEMEPKSLSNPNGHETLGNIGIDIKYGLSSNLTLDATINPDFGQVELDSPVLNLSAFETWFPERRPFFLEGANLFQTPFMLFYSRRIGRSPNNDVDDDELDDYLSYPKATTILGAAKLTGKLNSGTSVGLISAITDQENADYITETEEKRNGIVEPKANYTILRIQQDVLSNSNIGSMLTVTSQDTEHPAITGGVDWRLSTTNGKMYFNGQTVFSRVDDENVGFGATIELGKRAGKHVRGAIGGTVKDPHLSINRLGYTSRNDSRYVWGWVQYRTQDDWWIIRNTWVNLNTYFTWNYMGNNLDKGGNINGDIKFINNWWLGGGFALDFDEYSDMETRGNGLWKCPGDANWNWWASFSTDSRKIASFRVNPGGGQNRSGWWWSNYVGMDYRPRSNMEFSIGVDYDQGNNQIRWVENTGDSSIFAEINQNEISLYTSASIMVNRNLSCQLSTETLISGMDYKHYRAYQGGDNYSHSLSGFDHDGNFSALNSSLIVRWEYGPGSTLYLVWTRSRSEFDNTANNLDISRDFKRLFSEGADNVFLIKASYWLNI